MLTKSQIENITKNQVVTFATCDKNGMPRCVWVQPSKVEKNRIIISAIQMEKTFENLKENSKCFINVYFPEQDDLQYKIEGRAKIETSGKLFEQIKAFEESENLPEELKVNAIVIVEIVGFEQSCG